MRRHLLAILIVCAGFGLAGSAAAQCPNEKTYILGFKLMPSYGPQEEVQAAGPLMHTFDGAGVKHRWMGLFQTFESVGSGPDAMTIISEYQGKELQALFPIRVGDRISLERKTTMLTRESKLLPAPPPATREKLEIVVSHSEAIAIGPCSYDTLVVAQKSTDLETGQIVETRFNYAPSIRYVIKDTMAIKNPGQPPGKPSELSYDGIALK